MAFSFGGSTANNLRRTPRIFPGDPRPITIACRLKRAATTQCWIFEDEASGDPGVAVAVSSGTTTSMRLYTNGAYNDSTTFSNDITTWHSYVWTYNTGTPGAISFYRDTALVSSTTATYNSVGVPTVSASVLGALIDDFAGTPTANFFINGSLADFAIWQSVLAADDAIAYGRGFSPLLIQPTSLLSYVPLIADTNRDLRLGDWTQSGTLTKQADHPRVLWPNGPLRIRTRPAAVIQAKSFPWRRPSLAQQHLLVR